MCLGVAQAAAAGQMTADYGGRGRAMGLTDQRSEPDALDRPMEAVQTRQARVPGPKAPYLTCSPWPRLGRW